MRKRIVCILSALLVMLALTACGTDPTKEDYNGRTYDQLKDALDLQLQYVSALQEMFVQSEMSVDELKDEELRDYLKANYGITDAQMDGLVQWDRICDQFGEFKKTEKDSFAVEKAGKTLTTNLVLVFENSEGQREVDFQVVYDSYSMKITGITIEPVYSMGEKLQKAGLNTLISMGIVFVVLILISLIIYAFNIFPYLEKRKKEKVKVDVPAVESPPVQKTAVPVPAAMPVKREDDTQLVAVIAAAIAAATGSSTSDFVVRSIRRR